MPPSTLAAASTVPLHRDGVVPAARAGRAPRVVAAVLAVLGGAATVAALYVLAVLDPAGRAADEAVMRAAMSVGLRSEGLVLLELVGVPSVALAVVVLAGIAFLRGRGRSAVAVVAIVLGAQIVTQLLKAGLLRPGAEEANSLPSGHVTLVASLGVALVVVVPRALRPLAAVVAVAVTGIAGVATMTAGWHRPSDVVAAVGVVVAVTGAVSLARALRPAARARPRSA